MLIAFFLSGLMFWFYCPPYLLIISCCICSIPSIPNVENKNIPEDFGVLLTKDNIDEHLENLRNQIEEYDLNKLGLD